MTRETRNIIKFILKLIKNKNAFFFWFFVRFISALLPLLTIYLFSRIIKLLENHAGIESIVQLVLVIFLIRIFDNFSRLISIYKLEYLIKDTEFSIHNLLLAGYRAKNKEQRHQTIQAVRNFSEAVRTTFNILRQPGIDGFVSFVSIPIILLFLDFRIFIIEIAYITIYYFADIYTTERYTRFRDIQNKKTEVYFAKLQDNNNVKKEKNAFFRQFIKLCNWGFVEWFTIQNVAVIFYSLILFLLAHSVSQGQKQISDLVLVMGYVASTQAFLNNISSIKDRLADTRVALERLASSRKSLHFNLSDLT